MNFERREPFSGAISAPYRLDCAITYSLPEGASPDFAPTKQVDRELTTAEWKSIFDKAFLVGIPHLVITGGEPTLREDLPDLLIHAERNGQVTGLLTDGLRLADQAYLETLLQTGLDYLTFIQQPDADTGWNGTQAPAPVASALEGALAANICVAVHLTLTPRNIDHAQALLGSLADQGVRAVSLSASDPALRPALASLRDWTAARQLELIWNLPVPYSAQNPVALETGREIPEGAGRAWLYVEPDGDVLPSQGMNRVLGNLLRDPWEKILENPGLNQAGGPPGSMSEGLSPSGWRAALFPPGWLDVRAAGLPVRPPGSAVQPGGFWRWASGTGALLGELQAKSQAEVYGIDINPQYLALVQEQKQAADPGRLFLVQADAHHLPFASASFDLALCHFLLLWVLDPARVLTEMRRTARPGGAVLALAEPDYGGRIDYPPELATLGERRARGAAPPGGGFQPGAQAAQLVPGRRAGGD